MYHLKTPPLLYTLRSTVKCTIEEVRVRVRVRGKMLFSKWVIS